jgi:hypothetical protein
MAANSLYDARPGGARVDRLRLRTDPSAYDPDDMFGVRRALAVLPTEAHDRFFDRWVVLTEDADYDVRRIHAAVRVERAAPASDGLGPAWVTVDDAITAYLGWRSAR